MSALAVRRGCRFRLDPLPTVDPGLGCQPDFVALPPARRMFLNCPHNPTGALAHGSTLAEAVAWARRTGGLLAHDVAQGAIVFDERRARARVT